MTSFVIGQPPSFKSGAFGDLSVFKRISQVSDQLYICGVMALTEERVKDLKIDLIVNATLDWPFPRSSRIEGVRVAVDDIPTASLLPYFDKIADKINITIQRGGRVLVHCMAGVSRSCSLCIAYLMKHRGMSLKEAYRLMSNKRPIVRPNEGFWRQLGIFERQIRNNRQSQEKSNGSSSLGTLSLRRVTPLLKAELKQSGSDSVAAAAHRSSPSTDRSMSKSLKGLSVKPTASHGDKPRHSLAQSTSASKVGYSSPIKHDQSYSLPSARIRVSQPPPGHSHSVTYSRAVPVNQTQRYVVEKQPAQRGNQGEIALAALRGKQWSTTYGSDFSRHSSK